MQMQIIFFVLYCDIVVVVVDIMLSYFQLNKVSLAVFFIIL